MNEPAYKITWENDGDDRVGTSPLGVYEIYEIEMTNGMKNVYALWFYSTCNIYGEPKLFPKTNFLSRKQAEDAAEGHHAGLIKKEAKPNKNPLVL